MIQVERPVDVRGRLDAALAHSRLGHLSDDFIPANQSHVEAPPPAYPIDSWEPGPATAPAYTAQPHPTERVISRTDSPDASAVLGPHPSSRPLPDIYQTKSTRLILDLGRRIWPSVWPVYGANGVVSGKVNVLKADHAVDIYVTLEGVCIATLVERGMPAAQFQTSLVHQAVKLWSNDTGNPPQPSYEFSFSLPTYSRGRIDPLPPSSYHSVLMRGYVEVKYFVKVDMTRTRFHRHESILSNIHYLPRSYSPPGDLQRHEINTLALIDESNWRTIKLLPVVARSNRKSRGVTLSEAAKNVSVQVSLLKRQVYTAYTPIIFRLSFRASSPALALLPHAAVQLIKRYTLAASPLNVYVAREAILGNGEVWHAEETEVGTECLKIVSGYVAGGKQEAEVSWSVEGVFKVEYLIRVRIKPPEDMRFLGACLPDYFYQEIVHMTTHEYIGNELERSHPSLALAPDGVY